MSKFTVGQTVKVREDLVVGEDYGYFFNGSMGTLRGKEVTIASIYDGRITLDGEGAGWSWSEEMFEELAPKNPMRVIELGQSAKLEIYVDRVIVNDPATILFYRTANYDNASGQFASWSDTKKVVAKVNPDAGDQFDVGKGIDVALLKAFRKEIDKQLRKF
ncbi:hypothetical protein AAXB25_15075 [Paenibacillus lautus]|uniref:hypothetical protein n=1 Tax=Paenibacillus lautus TaxID=1401 RepID=UPI003D2C97E9